MNRIVNLINNPFNRFLTLKKTETVIPKISSQKSGCVKQKQTNLQSQNPEKNLRINQTHNTKTTNNTHVHFARHRKQDCKNIWFPPTRYDLMRSKTIKASSGRSTAGLENSPDPEEVVSSKVSWRLVVDSDLQAL